MNETSRKPVVRVIAGALAVPLATFAATALTLLSWWDELPDPIATHWTTSGAPDGFSSPAVLLAWFAVLGTATLAATLWGARPESSGAVRTIVSLASGTGVFLMVSVLGTLAPQRGIPDAATVPLPGWAFLWGALAGIAAGFVTALLVPRWSSPPPTDGLTRVGPIAELGPTERVVWTRVASTARPGVIIAVAATLLVLVLSLVAAAWWLLVFVALLVLLLVAVLTVRVMVDPNGLRVAGPLGWPRVQIRTDDVASVATADVHALREFGGWGYRVAFAGPLVGAKGFVLRSGPAIVVTRRSGGVEVVVVDDAATGAALLEAYRRRVPAA